MQLRYAFRLHPDAGRQTALARAFGCVRVVFNHAVRAREEARRAGRPFPGAGELSTRVITEAKRTVERSWLGEVSVVVLQQSLRDAEAAYKNFFASFKGTRKGPKLSAPRFKSRKDTRQSIRFTANARFFASFVTGTDPAADANRMPASGQSVGIDLGLTLPHSVRGTPIAVLSTGEKLSTRLISENQGIAVESLSVAGLARTKPAKSVHDAGWTAFVNMLEYKAQRYGRALVKIGRFEPTSQTCSLCGTVDGPKPLHIREWTCTACGTLHDRDHNAALNIHQAAGLAVTACGAPVRPESVRAQREETGSHGFPTGNRAA
ncbi:RNA-guided endonuclease InsQ/TnpB family protein [Streptomyces pseudovenezuelae]|uniref:RNA-guided endonuclease InsQ/TnpB family protein n=1 Tax=Streptomyces pseudovenezuelae TaxID=67350 RepID=UPI0024737197|nr:RNA-guided endonuclease TnpB family protein [Streptomyces pseudovenezuelae]